VAFIKTKHTTQLHVCQIQVKPHTRENRNGKERADLGYWMWLYSEIYRNAYTGQDRTTPALQTF
jgi:hypothetical protein